MRKVGPSGKMRKVGEVNEVARWERWEGSEEAWWRKWESGEVRRCGVPCFLQRWGMQGNPKISSI